MNDESHHQLPPHLINAWLRETARSTRSGADPQMNQYLCSLWLAQRQLELQLSNEKISKLTGIEPHTLSRLKLGLMTDEAGLEACWSALVYLLSRSPEDSEIVSAALDIARGQLLDPRPQLLEQIRTDLRWLEQRLSSEQVLVLDTTLRNGLEAGGIPRLSIQEHLDIAEQIVALGVDILEAGTPEISERHEQIVRSIAQRWGTADGPVIAAAAHADKEAIDTAWSTLQPAVRRRLHIFLSTSDLHIEVQLRSTRQAVLQRAYDMVRYARSLCDDVQFSAIDATRSDRAFLREIVAAVISAGATTVNLPDTVGIAMPDEYRELFEDIQTSVVGLDAVILSAHCHNDLGQAIANTLSAVVGGARQVECTIIGIGERAGNAAIEAVVMGLLLRTDYYQGITTRVNPQAFAVASRLVSDYTKKPLPPMIVDPTAYYHKDHIHRAGEDLQPGLFSIIQPEQVGLRETVLDNKSTYGAFRLHLREMGFEIGYEQARRLYIRFRALADHRHVVSAPEIISLISEPPTQPEPEVFHLEYFSVTSGLHVKPHAWVMLRDTHGSLMPGESSGSGPVNAVFEAINTIILRSNLLQPEERIVYSSETKMEGVDSAAQVDVRVRIERQETSMPTKITDFEVFVGHGIDTDTVVAAANAYMDSLNKLLRSRNALSRKYRSAS